MGYFGVDRRLREHWIYQDAEYLKVWLEMLFLARFSEDTHYELVDGDLVPINYGEFMFGRIKWSQRLRIGEQRLRTLIARLKKENMIELILDHRKCSVYRVVNYAKFNHDSNQHSSLVPQGIDADANQHSNPQLTISQPSVNQQPTTKEERSNKDNKDNKVINKKNTRPKSGELDPTKVNYSEFVWLKPEEFEKVVATHGQEATLEMIDILNSYKASSGKKYPSDYHTMVGRGWVLDRYSEEQAKKLRVIPGGGQRYGRNETGGYGNLTEPKQSSLASQFTHGFGG